MDGIVVDLSVLVNLIPKAFVEGHKNGSRLTRQRKADSHGD